MRTQLFEQPAFIPVFLEIGFPPGVSVGITGGRGVLGRVMVDRLVNAGASVSRFDGDVRSRSELEAWAASDVMNVVYHLAAVVPVDTVVNDPLRALEVNAIATGLVASAVLSTNPQCWFFGASTSHVYPAVDTSDRTLIGEASPVGPSSLYGKTKLLGEQILTVIADACGAEVCIGRIFSFSHRTQRPPYLIPTILNRLQELEDGGTLRLANTTSVRDFLDAETVVDCLLQLAIRRYKGTVNIASGKGSTLASLVAQLATNVGKSIVVTSTGEESANAIVADVTRLRSIMKGQ